RPNRSSCYGKALFNLVRSFPPTLRYEPGLIVAEGDFDIVHGRFSGFAAPANWIAADILRIQDGILIEHWEVIQHEVARDQSKSARPMFGESFPVYRCPTPPGGPQPVPAPGTVSTSPTCPTTLAPPVLRH